MKKLALAIAFTLTAAAALAAPETFVSDRPHCQANFSIRHMMSQVSGRFDDFAATIVLDRANPAASSVEFHIKTASINTGVADRDNHLRSPDFFDAAKNPEITFKSASVKPKGKDLFEVTGDLTMHGVTKRITLPVTFFGFMKDPWGNERAGFEVNTTLNRKDYGITWNKALDNGGVLLGDEVRVTINIEALAKK